MPAETTAGDRVVLLVELIGGEVVAVPFTSRERADWWEDRMPYEVVGRPRIVTAKSLAVGAAIMHRRSETATDRGESTPPTSEAEPADLRALRDAHGDAQHRLAAAERTGDEDTILDADRAERAARTPLAEALRRDRDSDGRADHG